MGDFNEILDKSFFKIILEIGGWGISYEIALTWMSQTTKTTLFY